MPGTNHRIALTLDASLVERARAYGAENGLSLDALVEQGLLLRLDDQLASSVENGPAPPVPDLRALVDGRIREQLPQIVREWLESARGAACLERLLIPYVPGAARREAGAAAHVAGTGEGQEVPLPLPVLARLQRQRMIRLEEATGVDIPTLHALRTGTLSWLPKTTLERLVAGLEEVEADTDADHELEGMHG